jgi:hypothetical protein
MHDLCVDMFLVDYCISLVCLFTLLWYQRFTFYMCYIICTTNPMHCISSGMWGSHRGAEPPNKW